MGLDCIDTLWHHPLTMMTHLIETTETSEHVGAFLEGVEQLRRAWQVDQVYVICRMRESEHEVSYSVGPLGFDSETYAEAARMCAFGLGRETAMIEAAINDAAADAAQSVADDFREKAAEAES